MNWQFEVPPEEREAANAFVKEHRHSDVYRGAIGGSVVVSFMNTSIGRICSIECPICHLIKDFSGNL